MAYETPIDKFVCFLQLTNKNIGKKNKSKNMKVRIRRAKK